MSAEGAAADPRIEVGLPVFLGGVMFIVEAAYEAAVAGQFATAGFAISPSVTGVIALTFVVGVVLLLLDLLYHVWPDDRHVIGTFVIVSAVFGLLLGGGLLVGTILATVGGIFAVILPEETPIVASSTWADLPTPATSSLGSAPTGQVRPAATPATLASRFIVRYCLSCGAANSSSASACARCRAALPTSSVSRESRGGSSVNGVARLLP